MSGVMPSQEGSQILVSTYLEHLGLPPVSGGLFPQEKKASLDVFVIPFETF